MLEFAPTPVAVVRCLGQPGALDALSVAPDAFAGRIAPDELLVVGPRGEGALLLDRVTADLARLDPDGLAVDQSDGWSMWTLSGPDAPRAWARLSTTRLPRAPGFVQGAIGGIPAKAVVLTDRLHLMVSSVLGHHLRDRIAAACADLEPRAGTPAPFVAPTAGRAA